MVEIGARTVVDVGGCVIARSGVLSIGPDSYVGRGSVITAIERVVIGRDALIAEHVTIRDQDHDYTHKRPYRLAGMKVSSINIGDNVWIGAKATITRGVTIGSNAVIGANSVVTHDVPANAVVAGVPAKLVRFIDA
jgi:acetyltransferase-like isoleucine patch superfamily enzyme